jgi:hypothetical protein
VMAAYGSLQTFSTFINDTFAPAISAGVAAAYTSISDFVNNAIAQLGSLAQAAISAAQQVASALASIAAGGGGNAGNTDALGNPMGGTGGVADTPTDSTQSAGTLTPTSDAGTVNLGDLGGGTGGVTDVLPAFATGGGFTVGGDGGTDATTVAFKATKGEHVDIYHGDKPGSANDNAAPFAPAGQPILGDPSRMAALLSSNIAQDLTEQTSAIEGAIHDTGSAIESLISNSNILLTQISTNTANGAGSGAANTGSASTATAATQTAATKPVTGFTPTTGASGFSTTPGKGMGDETAKQNAALDAQNARDQQAANAAQQKKDQEQQQADKAAAAKAAAAKATAAKNPQPSDYGQSKNQPALDTSGNPIPGSSSAPSSFGSPSTPTGIGALGQDATATGSNPTAASTAQQYMGQQTYDPLTAPQGTPTALGTAQQYMQNPFSAPASIGGITADQGTMQSGHYNNNDSFVPGPGPVAPSPFDTGTTPLNGLTDLKSGTDKTNDHLSDANKTLDDIAKSSDQQTTQQTQTAQQTDQGIAQGAQQTTQSIDQSAQQTGQSISEGAQQTSSATQTAGSGIEQATTTAASGIEQAISALGQELASSNSGQRQQQQNNQQQQQQQNNQQQTGDQNSPSSPFDPGGATDAGGSGTIGGGSLTDIGSGSSSFGVTDAGGSSTISGSISDVGTAIAPSGSGDVSGFAGDFATGGSFVVGGDGGTDTTRISFNATKGEVVTITAPGMNDNGIPGSGATFDAGSFSTGGTFTVPGAGSSATVTVNPAMPSGQMSQPAKVVNIYVQQGITADTFQRSRAQIQRAAAG